MQVPFWLLGQGLTAITVTPLVSDAQGTLTTTNVGTTAGFSSGSATAAKSLSGRIDGVNIVINPYREMIMSLDGTMANYELIYDDFDLQLVEILSKKTTGTGGYAPILPYMAATFARFLIGFTRGGQPWSCYGIRGRLTDGVQNYGKNSCGLQFSPFTMVDGTATLTFTP